MTDMSLQEKTSKEIVTANIKLLSGMKHGLEKKISGRRNHDSIVAFFDKMQRVMKSMEQMVPSGTVCLNGAHESNRSDEKFLYNIKRLLDVLPQDSRYATMEQVPVYFRKSIDKIVTYLHGDTDWLTVSRNFDTKSSFEESGFQLSVETDLTKTEQGPERRRNTFSGRRSEVDGLCKSGTIKDYEYLIEYKDISKKKEITHIIDPLFELLYPQKTLVSSMKHCKEATGKTLGAVSKTKLGEGEAGSKFLYKIITDKTLARIFGDDRIIATLGESIHIPLLKVIIYTAVYRLRKKPGKFPAIGGVSYFVELEDEMLGTTLIRDALLDLMVTRTGSKAIFQPAGSRERGGLESMLDDNLTLYQEIGRRLLNIPDKAQAITRYWTLKFSCMFARNAKVNSGELQILFLPETVLDIEKFIKSAK